MLKAFFISLVLALLFFVGLIAYEMRSDSAENLQTNLLSVGDSAPQDIFVLSEEGEILPLSDAIIESEAGERFDYSVTP